MGYRQGKNRQEKTRKRAAGEKNNSRDIKHSWNDMRLGAGKRLNRTGEITDKEETDREGKRERCREETKVKDKRKRSK